MRKQQAPKSQAIKPKHAKKVPKISSTRRRFLAQQETCVGLKDLEKLNMTYDELKACGAIVPAKCVNCGYELEPHYYELVAKIDDASKKKIKIHDLMVTSPLIKISKPDEDAKIWSGFFVSKESSLLSYVDDQLPGYTCSGACQHNHNSVTMQDLKTRAAELEEQLMYHLYNYKRELVELCHRGNLNPNNVHAQAYIRVTQEPKKSGQKQVSGFSRSFVLSYLKKHKISVSTVNARSKAVGISRYGNVTAAQFVCFSSAEKNLQSVNNDYYLYSPSILLKSKVEELLKQKGDHSKTHEAVQ